MNTAAVAACIVAWFAAAPASSSRGARRRLACVVEPAAAAAHRPDATDHGTRVGVRRRDGAVAASTTVTPGVRAVGAAGAALASVVVGGALGVALALPAALAVWRLTARLEPAALRRRRASASRDLPVALDLLAACLDAGAPPDRALAVVGDALGDVVGDAMRRAAAVLVLGASVDEVAAGWRADPSLEPLEPLVRLVRRSGSGAALAGACARLAADLRERRRLDVDAVARRVGVRAAAPLGVCFLPAFVLLGVVPVVLSGARALLG